MGAPAQLALLREVVGAGPPDDVLSAAWQQSGGDLAAAVNIILDGPSLSRPRPVPAPPEPSEILLLDDDSDAEDKAPVTVQAAFPRALSGGSSQPCDLIQVKQEASINEPPTKRLRTWDLLKSGSKPVQSAPPGPRPLLRACDMEWALQLGSFEVYAYSTTRLSPDQRFSTGEADGSCGPLLRPHARLELKWNIDAKKAKGRPGSAAASAGQESGTVRFDVCGQEVGKFPSWVAKALVPLLSRRLIDVEAVLGSDPPRHLDLGTTVPAVVRVSLRSAALCTPGQVVAAAGRNAGASMDSAGAGSAKLGKPKGQKAVQKEEADKEVQRTATAMLLEKLKLPCRRQAAGGSGDAPVPSCAGASDDTAGGTTAAAEEDAEEDQEMSRAAAAQLGSSNHLERHDLPGIALPAGIFGARLRPYQAQAVYWMWQKENPTSSLPSCYKVSDPHSAPTEDADSRSPNAGRTQSREQQLHPMWDEYELPEATGPLPGGRGAVKFLYHHRTTGALSLDFPDAALAHCRGGILADDMGLGKTVMCLALVSLDYGPSNLPSARKAAPELRALEDADNVPAPKQRSSLFQQTQPPGDDGVGGVLVVAPLSLIRQWHTEVDKHFLPAARPSVHEFHGSGRNGSVEQLRNFGVVLTTYGTLSAQPEDSPLFQIYWRRVILDEAHTIKNRVSRQAQAAFRLKSFCRWCVTGTPLQNSVEELYSPVRFLRVDPWSTWSCWRQSVAIPLERGRHGDGDSMTLALDTARRIVTPLLLRRTKDTVDPRTGKPLLQLPRKHVHVRRLELSLVERDFYDAVWSRAKTEFDTFLASGEALSKYTHILQLILKLRQALCHPFLVFARESGKDEDMDTLQMRCLKEMTGEKGLSESYVSNILEDIKKGDLSDCSICCDTPQDPTMTPCGHIFCRECCFQIIKQCHGECPVCRKPGINQKTLRVLPGASRFPSQLLAKASAAGSKDAGDSAHSTKMKDLLSLLREDMAAGHRAVVFSQWTSFLDLIGSALESAGIAFQRFDGSLSLDERAARVAWLSEECKDGSSGARVLMVSLKSGGSGLNLVAASRLYLMDLWWNPAVEEQAIQRVHRIGQKQEVHIFKFVVVDSIDMDLLELHKAKERLLEDALSGGRHQEAATKLTMDDLKRLFNPCRSSLRGLRGGPKIPTEAEANEMAREQYEEARATYEEELQEVDMTDRTRPEPLENISDDGRGDRPAAERERQDDTAQQREAEETIRREAEARTSSEQTGQQHETEAKALREAEERGVQEIAAL
eukprot:TRINITY_DN2334_c0_g1_i6.p1 TRINITY_DN2334_c0_g1~~TRINITY_DN2334_c0_g1_i6.p1  ORF type:complete len:1267 (-),score=295.30 TRINITY_DN2334_c0_g1_i6:975-4775(-)